MCRLDEAILLIMCLFIEKYTSDSNRKDTATVVCYKWLQSSLNLNDNDKLYCFV